MVHQSQFVEVAFSIPARQQFTYGVPHTIREIVLPGCRVIAPLGNRNALGFVVGIPEEPPANLDIKSIQRCLDQEPLFDAELLAFLQWVSDYYMASLGETLSAAYPFAPSIKPRMIKVVILEESIRESGTIPEAVHREKQRKVLEFLINRKALLSPQDIVRELAVSPSTIKSLEKQGWLRIGVRETQRESAWTYRESTQPSLILTEEQQAAIALIESALQESHPKPILIQGVTGSGKTEIYLQAIERTLKLGKSALALIPEISLTPQTMDRFRLRFGERVGILHSGLGQGERYDEWRLAKQGVRRIVVGTRSAVFAPLQNLGIIIVDEEHDGSYKQSDPNPRYQGRDLAIVRAHRAGALCILGTATPAIESAYNVTIQKYRGIPLAKRIASHGLPSVQLLDMRGRAEAEEVLAQELQEALWNCRERHQQAILFLNRRGFATTLSCKHCGKILTCEHCSVALVYHKTNHLLICHHCDYRCALPEMCPACSEKFIRQRGFGTERVVQEVEKLVSGIRVLRMDRDATQRKGEHDRLLNHFRLGNADVLVGTQMIAKGLDFPNVTLVGVINADYALSLPDFRASERTFTMLMQVAGRAGRGEHPGEVLVQSYCPDHYSIQLALHQDYHAFYEKEIRYRRLIGFPPFSRLVLWRIEGVSEDQTRGKAWELFTILSESANHLIGVTLLPPVEAPLYRLRDHYRWQIAVKSRDYKSLRALLNNEKLEKILTRRQKGLRVIQDVDPWDML